MTGMNAKSPSLTVAGSRGFSPMSQQVHTSVLTQHWATYAAAADSAGHLADRSDWRICRDFLVAETDEQARDAYLNGPMGDLWQTYNIPTFIQHGIGELISGGQIPPEQLSAEWLIDNNFHLVGSPETVAAKIEALYQEVGGFGTLVSFGHEYVDDPAVYRRSFELIGSQVAPLVSHLWP